MLFRTWTFIVPISRIMIYTLLPHIYLSICPLLLFFLRWWLTVHPPNVQPQCRLSTQFNFIGRLTSCYDLTQCYFAWGWFRFFYISPQFVFQLKCSIQHTSDSSQNQNEQHKIADCKCLFRCSVETFKVQLMVHRQTFIILFATEKLFADHMWNAGRMFCRPGISHLAHYFNYESSEIQSKSYFSSPSLCAD